MQIIKSDGKVANFDEARLARALDRARVDKAITQEIMIDITKLVRPGTSTQLIHDRVLHTLEARDLTAAARFNLKHAMLNLGPSGFPFEQYFARLMQAYGWHTQVGATVPGRCVEHEVDIYASRTGDKKRAIEAKYHNVAGGRTDVKVALYVHARHEDLTARDPDIQGALVTNTQFTQDAILYGECVGMKMKAWNYPLNEGLAKYIEEKQLYPITVFSRLSPHVLSVLLQNGIVLASQLCHVTESDAARMMIVPASLQELRTHAMKLCASDSSS
ncbi:restriction endonuclease [Candidatus Uhrbacteria bacterium]|nr:restriction endonuclease [Candidatus Uhrbacteria bacterium]